MADDQDAIDDVIYARELYEEASSMHRAGYGKSLLAMRIAEQYPKQLLIVTPISFRQQWENLFDDQEMTENF